MAGAFEARSSGGARAFVCRPLENAGFLNAFSSRAGGVSPLPANALNLSYPGDDPANVEENRRRFLRAAGLPSCPIVTARQTHSTIVIEAGAPLSPEPEGDAVISKTAGIYVGVKTADCVPILLGDPVTGLAAAVHAGWRGAAGNIAREAVAALSSAGARAPDLIAAIGPAACGRCLEIGADVAERFLAIGAAAVMTTSGRRTTLDVAALCARQLEDAGVLAPNVHRTDLCTMHEEGVFFSHRRDATNGVSVGRQLSIVGRRA